MGQLNLSSSPLSTLFPQFSPEKEPHYNSSFNIDFSNLQYITFPNYSQNFKQNNQFRMDQLTQKIGETLSNSSNKLTQLQGSSMLQQQPKNNSQLFPTQDSTGFSNRFQNSTFGEDFETWDTGLNMANTAFTSIFGDKNEYQGEKGDVAQSIDSTYDTIQNTVGSFGPIGQVTSLMMGANKLLGNVANKLGGGTDGMTTTDAVLGSSFLQLTPFGLINGFGGKKANTITKNDLAFETVGSSYSGTNSTVNDALTKSGKKYGLFSSNARNKANEEIAEAERQQNIMEEVADEATNRFAIRNSMSAINGNRRLYNLYGGYNQQNVRVGKNGMNIQLLKRASNIVSKMNSKNDQPSQNSITSTEILLVDTPKFQNGGFIDNSTIKPTEILLVDPNSILEFQQGGQINTKSRTLSELIDYAKKVNPRFIQRMSEPLKYVEWDDENGHHFGTHELGYTEIDGKYFIYPNIQETSNGDLIRYPSDKWKEAVDNAYKNKNGLFFNTEEEAKLFTESGENPDGTFYGYKSGWPEFFKQDLINKHQKGGSINVIPEGALHARKHNMDIEGITQKGIPVVTEDKEGNIEQQAEIEKEEIIFRLEVTKKLEELEKKYYDSETSQTEKDECALEAGKLLVQEILYNTADNVDLINKV